METSKRLKKRQQNREAAAKFRQKTKQQIDDLAKEVKQQCRRNDQIQSSLNKAQKELEFWRKAFMDQQQGRCNGRK